MKYVYLLILLALFTNSPLCFSQKGSIHLSLNNGINHSNYKLVKIEAYYPSEWKSSYRYGFGVSYEVLNNLQLGIEGNVEEKGWLRGSIGVIDTLSGAFLTGSGDYYYPFVSIPLIANYSFGFKKVKLFVEGGYLINLRRQGTTIKTEPANTIPMGEYSFEQLGTEYGWMYGGGIKVNIYHNWSIVLTGRYAVSHIGVGYWGVEEVNLRHQNYAGLLAVTYRIPPRKNKM